MPFVKYWNLNRLFNKNIASLPLNIEGNRILVAISGGCDSVLLAHLLIRNRFDIQLAHINFHLRGAESDADEEFVRQFAKANNLKLHVDHCFLDKKRGIQEQARKLRYDRFHELLRKENLDLIATGHHADDNTETFLLHLLRGAGTHGLSGMKILEGKLFRPLLAFDRSEIEKEAKKLGLEWREDSSNKSDKYTRNKLRLDIIPMLKEINPGLNETLARTMDLMREADHMTEDSAFLMPEVLPSGQSRMSISALRECKYPLTVLNKWMVPPGFSPGQAREALKLAESQSGRQITTKLYVLLRDRNHLLMTEKQTGNLKEITVQSETEIELGGYSFKLCIPTVTAKKKPDEVRFSIAKAPFPWVVRSWQKGDKIKIAGLNGSKKLSDIFIQKKIPLPEKANYPVWECNGEIMWVTELAVSRLFLAEGDEPCISVCLKKEK